jgi:hypothetical protein
LSYENKAKFKRITSLIIPYLPEFEDFWDTKQKRFSYTRRYNMDKLFKDTKLFSELVKGSKSFSSLKSEEMGLVKMGDFSDAFLLKVVPIDSMSKDQQIDVYAAKDREHTRTRTEEEVKLAELMIAKEKQAFIDKAQVKIDALFESIKVRIGTFAKTDSLGAFLANQTIDKKTNQFRNTKAMSLSKGFVTPYKTEVPNKSLRTVVSVAWTIVDTPKNSAVDKPADVNTSQEDKDKAKTK